ncbi:MAG: autotransporter domain-containing protein [Alphaproteobacteria bacterium]
MKYSKRAITQLTRAYKSVLIKCFLINCGMFAIMSPANASYGDLAEAVADTTTPREYILSDNEVVSSALGTMGGTNATLTIDGSANKYGINADNVAGITVGSGNSLVLQNLGSVTISGDGKAVADYTVNNSVNGFKAAEYGGFVNNAGSMTIKDSVFSNNAARYGTVINNSGTNANISEITNATFYGNKLSDTGGTINNNSGASIGDINANFVNNRGDGPHIYGLSIYNNGGSIGNISGKFVGGNITATQWAVGEIYNSNASTQNISADFISNSVTATYLYGGVIYNEISSIGDITGNFENNTADCTGTYLTGSVIANTSGSSIGNITGDFKNNTASSMATTSGIIANIYSSANGNYRGPASIGNISGNFENNTLSGNNVRGVVYNQNSQIGDITGDFKNNTLTGNQVSGGVYNSTSASVINKIEGSTFENNVAEGGSSYAIGAAITNFGTITEGIINAKFINNHASSVGSEAMGGAIWTSKSIKIAADGAKGDGVSTFKGNYVEYDGFKGNEAIAVQGASNTLTLETKNGGVINMYDYIWGTSGFKTKIIGDGTGTMNLYNDIKDSNVSVENTTVNIDNNQIKTSAIEFGADTTLNLAVNTLEDHGKITAGTITINPGAKLNVTLANGLVKYSETATVQLLEADNTDFNNFTDSFDNKRYRFVKDGKNGAYIISMGKSAEDVAREAGGTEAEIEAAKAWVDEGGFTPGTRAAKVADKLDALAQTDGKAFNKALSEIAPAVMPTAQTIMTGLTDKLLLTIDGHLAGKNLGGISSGESELTLDGITIWAKAYQGKSKLNNAFDSDNRGVIAGLDRKMSSSVKLGFGLQYDDNDIDALGRDVDVNTLTGFVYGQYKPNKWFVSGVASFGKSDYDEDKSALNMKIKDNFAANIYSLQALTGYDFKYLTPEIGARYYRIQRHGYQDNIGQDISGKNMDVLRGVFGLHTSYEFGMFKPEVYAGIAYDFVRDSDSAVVSLPNGTSYMVQGDHMKRFGYEFNVGLNAQLTDNTSAYLGYEGKYREHYQDHTGTLNLKYSF